MLMVPMASNRVKKKEANDPFSGDPNHMYKRW